MTDLFTGKAVLVTGGTGSLGRALTRRLLRGDRGVPDRIVVFSRDERKQQEMRQQLHRADALGEHLAYRDHRHRVSFRLGDVRDAATVADVLRGIDVVLHAAALKQVPTCEYEPWEAARTNIGGAHAIQHAIRTHALPVETVIGVSTDKACQPVNAMGMTKALQERVLTAANLHCPGTRFLCVRYGNVMGSRGSVIPLFEQQIAAGGPVTLTSASMTRFMLTVDQAVDTVWQACADGRPGEVWVPVMPSSRVVDVAKAMIGDRDIELQITGIRPGEKVHETLVGDDEIRRARRVGDYYVIAATLPELQDSELQVGLSSAYTSNEAVLDYAATRSLIAGH